MKPLILTNAIAINITKSMTMLSSILFFLNIILYDCVHGIHGGVHGMSSLLPNQ